MPRLLAAVLLSLLPLAGFAQDRPKAILVLDGSGSMWGQIDGVNKITIAQQVVGELLQGLPDEQQLGLTVYGHRRKGDCTDIETIVAPGAGTRGAIAAAVDGIKPKGKTPMTDAVIAAAEALRYTEERATVILVSDGIETCQPDPCAAARILEETGVDFTAHVVGFDVSGDAEALAQMQCLADETGGTFRTADNAEELAEALTVVAAEPPAPVPVPVRFRGIAGPGGPEITETLVWSIGSAEQTLADYTSALTLTFDLLPGEYRVEALWPRHEESAELVAQIGADTSVVTLVFPAPPPPPVKVDFYATDGANGPRITDPLVWTLHRDGAQIGDPLTQNYFSREMERGEYRVTVTRPADGAAAEEVFGVGQAAKRVILVLPEYRPAATIDAPASVVAGSTFDVRWTGPDARNDYIAAALPDARAGTYDTYTYTREGSPLKLKAPAEPGQYELRYNLAYGNKTLVAVTLTVTAVGATIEAPETAIAGETIDLRWTGPDYQNDYIAVSNLDDRDGAYVNYTYTREGSPLKLAMPVDPGEYELRYTMNEDKAVLVRVPITVTGLTASLKAPESVIAGAAIDVSWVGPDYRNDYVSVSEPGSREGAYATYAYTREGNPLTVAAPLVPGTYELRYVLNQDKKTAASRVIEVLPVSAALEAPDQAVAGATVQVNWKGPDYRNDYVSVAEPDANPAAYVNYAYTREGAPLGLQMPATPGSYELRYVANGQPRSVIATRRITVSPVSAELKGPPEAKIGQTISVSWQGPDYRNDYIAISKPGDNGHVSYTYTRQGSPLTIEAPEAPGTYELRYVMNQDRTVIATQPLVISE